MKREVKTRGKLRVKKVQEEEGASDLVKGV